MVVYPATNDQVDRLLSAAHRTSFIALRREDGLGWVQAALWSFATGRGAATQHHRTTFGYAINVFHSSAQAKRALQDARIPRRKYRVAHLPGLLYENATATESLTFLFFAFKNIEVESYYEYRGVAPHGRARSLRHTFNTQASHLAHLARVYEAQMLAPAPATTAPTRTPRPTDTPTTMPTPAPTATDTPVTTSPTVPPTSTASPTPTPSPTVTPTATATPQPLPISVAASAGAPQFAPNTPASIVAHVTSGGRPVSGARVAANFAFPGEPRGCSGITDSSGTATCSVTTPVEPDGAQITVNVEAIAQNGQSASTTTTITVGGGS